MRLVHPNRPIAIPSRFLAYTLHPAYRRSPPSRPRAPLLPTPCSHVPNQSERLTPPQLAVREAPPGANPAPIPKLVPYDSDGAAHHPPPHARSPPRTLLRVKLA